MVAWEGHLRAGNAIIRRTFLGRSVERCLPAMGLMDESIRSAEAEGRDTLLSRV